MSAFRLFLVLSFLVFVQTLRAQVATAAPHIQLTAAEKLWLSKNREVTFTGDPNWLPFEAFDKSGNYIGIVAEHLKLISELTGLRFKIIHSSTWTEATIKAKNGEVDLLSETDDSALNSHINFTNSYLTNPIVIVMRNSVNYINNILQIKDKKIGLIKDYGYITKIKEKYTPALHKVF